MQLASCWLEPMAWENFADKLFRPPWDLFIVPDSYSYGHKSNPGFLSPRTRYSSPENRTTLWRNWFMGSYDAHARPQCCVNKSLCDTFAPENQRTNRILPFFLLTLANGNCHHHWKKSRSVKLFAISALCRTGYYYYFCAHLPRVMLSDHLCMYSKSQIWWATSIIITHQPPWSK